MIAHKRLEAEEQEKELNNQGGSSNKPQMRMPKM
jgi:hypothetical protein